MKKMAALCLGGWRQERSDFRQEPFKAKGNIMEKMSTGVGRKGHSHTCTYRQSLSAAEP